MKNYEQYKRIIRFFTAVAILTVEIGVYWVFWQYVSESEGISFFRRGNWLMAAVYAILLLFFSRMYGGLRIGYLIGGAVVIEVIFNLPGMGMAIVSGIQSNYTLLVQGVVLVVAITFIIINIIVDMLYILIDPRIRTV